ncbi:MAG: DNA-binding response regulator, partial [Anaerolineales bacterium]|nr:DNA-binding response regulator [Anaerolineales bacterium]
AEVLSVSYNTVKSHMQNIFRKLGVSDRTQAAVWAIRHGLVP